MAGIAFPSQAYQNVTPFATQIVQNQAALTALGSSWSQTPSPSAGSIAPTDPGLTDTDIRLQQILVEMRIANQQLQNGFNLADDQMTTLRAEVLANDAALTS